MKRRFVLLEHTLAAGRHYDLMFERDDDLETWSFAERPRTPCRLTGKCIAPHRKHYLDHEGPVSGDRGDVRRIDAGLFRVLERTDVRIEFAVEGAWLTGRVVLVRRSDEDEWELLSEATRP